MLFKRIMLQNFKMYEGRNEFDLSINQKQDTLKNIILIGGLNGNGKTTLLEAIKLCLYGKKAKHLFGNGEYDSFVTSRFSKNALKKGEAEMKISVEFEDVYFQGLSNELFIERRWFISTYSESVKIKDESFSVKKGNDTNDVFGNNDNNDAEKFIYQLMPPEITQFFFFDGEKIQEMAEDRNYGERISQALRDVLGISLIDTLREDLQAVRREYSKGTTATDIKKQIAQKESEIAEIEGAKDSHEEKKFDLEQEIEQLTNQIENIRFDLERITNANLQDRDELKNREAEFQQKEQEIKEALMGILEFELPIGISAKLCVELKKRIELEHAFQLQDNAKQSLKPQLEKLLYEVFDQGEEPKTRISFSQIEFYKNKIRRIWYNLFELPENNIVVDEIWHDLNEREYQFIMQQIEKLSQNLIPKFENIYREKQRKASELRSIQRELEKSNDIEILRKIEEQNRLKETLGAKRNEKQTIEGNIEGFKRQCNGLDSQKKKLDEQFDAAEKNQEKGAFIRKLITTLNDYETELKKTRISELEEFIKEMFLRLCNKEDMVTSVHIDSHTFIVSIKDAQGRSLEKHNLSSGLKQIFALSLLWGLAKVSKIEIPMIIDTPFGRLDSIHRTNLLQNYYPNAGRQLIILSTDEEIDTQSITLLENHIAKTFLLERKSELEPTQIMERYF